MCAENLHYTRCDCLDLEGYNSEIRHHGSCTFGYFLNYIVVVEDDILSYYPRDYWEIIYQEISEDE